MAQAIDPPEGNLPAVQQEIFARAEGLDDKGVERALISESTNAGNIEGTVAVPNRETSPPLAQQRAEGNHVSMGDKVKGQIMIAKGVLKHDPNLTQEGEILKSEGEHVTIGKPHADAKAAAS